MSRLVRVRFTEHPGGVARRGALTARSLMLSPATWGLDRRQAGPGLFLWWLGSADRTTADRRTDDLEGVGVLHLCLVKQVVDALTVGVALVRRQ